MVNIDLKNGLVFEKTVIIVLEYVTVESVQPVLCTYPKVTVDLIMDAVYCRGVYFLL